MVLIASSSSVPPHIQPPIAQVPRPMREILSEVSGIGANSMSSSLWAKPSTAADRLAVLDCLICARDLRLSASLSDRSAIRANLVGFCRPAGAVGAPALGVHAALGDHLAV